MSEAAAAPGGLADLRRWVISAAIVVLAHGGIAAAMVTWRDTIEAAEPAGAIVIEFALLPVAPAAQRTEIPPGPEQVMSDAVPDKPLEKVEEKIEARIEAKGEEKIEEKVEPKTLPEPPRVAAPLTTAPPAAPAQVAAIAAAPTPGRPNPNNPNAVPTWRTQIVALLERNKRYPAAAQSRREQGSAQVFFSLDRQGRVVDSRVVRSSGAAALDAEALAMLRRAQPFPPPPPELAGDRVDLTVPIRFYLK